MDISAIISFVACIICLFIFGKIFILPIKSILKLIANSCIGAIIIYIINDTIGVTIRNIINLIGANFGFYIGINLGTAIFVGILGIPRGNIIGNIKIIYYTLLKSRLILWYKKSDFCRITTADLYIFLCALAKEKIYINPLWKI